MAAGFGIKLRNQLQAGWKYAISFRKHDWTLVDYPLWVHKQTSVQSDSSSRLKLIPYVASIVNWPSVSGGGDTREEALRALEASFARTRSIRTSLPRPGTGLPIEFASQDRIAAHPQLARDLIRRIFDIDGAWISDQTTLWDFHTEETNDRFYEKIRDTYGIDVSNIPRANLADILDRISVAGTVPRER
ncbi:MAG: hypothetical protein WBD25_21215 [Terriglobales bacterium]